MSAAMRGDQEVVDGAELLTGGGGAVSAAGRRLVTPLPLEQREIDAVRLEAIVAQHSWAGLAVKRAFDILVSAVGLALSAPIIAIMAVAVRLDSGGPALLRQTRVGRRQRLFTLTKLRTMDDEGRVTRVGRYLRPTGLDELPQLWCVLKGDMTLIGPRPEEAYLVARYDAEFPGYSCRHFMRPGITGWAQVNGLRGRVPISERLMFDLRYLRHWSLALDWRILVRTATAVWRDTRRALGR